MQATSVADEVLIQLGENVHMYIGTRAKPNTRVNLKGNANIQRSHDIPCNSHKYKYIYMHLYKKKTIRTHMFVDGVFWYTKHVHYTLVWI
jgi:hypothetical protein